MTVQTMDGITRLASMLVLVSLDRQGGRPRSQNPVWTLAMFI